MNLERDGIEAEIAVTASDFLSRRWPLSRVRHDLASDPLPSDLWRDIEDVGWLAMFVPTIQGGLGMGAVELGAVFEASGYHLVPGPLFDSVVVAGLVRERVQLDSHNSRFSFACEEPGREGGPYPRTTVVKAGIVTGTKVLVPYADCSDYLIVSAIDSGRTVIGILPADAETIEVQTSPTVDLISRPCEVTLRGAPLVMIVYEGAAGEAWLDKVSAYAWSMHAARMLGVMERLLEMAVEHATQRVQFGRPIGAFQAVQHMLADMHVWTRATRSTCYLSQVCLESGRSDFARRARVAKALASDAGRFVAETALQVMGGIGFTTESDLHLFLKHALTLQATWGDAPEHYDHLARYGRRHGKAAK